MSEGKKRGHGYGVASSAPAADLGDEGTVIGTCSDCQEEYNKKDYDGTCDKATEVVYRIDWMHSISVEAFVRMTQWCSAATMSRIWCV